MYLKSLELSGFKSFARKVSLQFSSPITAIVGPNGSGKSNTAEAFRFVLGEQSIKSLRGKHGEDMIWNGAGETGRANRASVRVTFDNSRRLFSGIDFDEVVLERAVNRDNSNEYRLNGSQVRLKDIVELLASAHIGSTGHHIISQGEADRILSASIRERREMIEDALGLKLYQWKKLESIRKLEKTEENMKQVESLRREIAPHIKFLKKQVEKVERAEQIRSELIQLYREYFAREESYLTVEKHAVVKELAGPRAEMTELEKALEQAKKVLTDSKTKDRASDEVIALERKLSETRLAKDAIVRELGRLEGEINANHRAIEKEKEKQKRDEFKTIYLKDLEEVVHSIEGLSSIEDAKRLFGEILGTLKSFIAKHRGVSTSSLIGEAEKEIAALTGQKEDQEGKFRAAAENESSLIRSYTELKNSIEREKDTNREAEKDVFRIIARQNEVRNTISNLQTRLNSLAHEEEQFKKDLGEAGMIVGREALDYRTIVIEHRPQGAQHLPVELVSSATAAPAEQEGVVLLAGGANTPAMREELRHKIEKNKIRLEDSGAAGGAEIMKEYRETEERDAFLGRELDDLYRAKNELLSLIADLEARIDYEFKSGILKINNEFQKYFDLMFGGGRAELIVVKELKRRRKSDAEDLSGLLSPNADADLPDGLGEAESETEGPEGVDVNVNLPRKKVKGLMMLSGGERALTSIALLFAISQVNPPPFIILDETDAALDEANSKKYGDMIENLSKASQLILITHNRETMSRAGVLYGVTMGSDGASKILSIAFEEAAQVAK
jgi:chromosome segregation protein